jgi:nitrite reductase/ring-hydroxylating ferredoxin subunit
MSSWIDVAADAEVEEDAILAVSANGLPLALCRQGESVYALYDLCSHGAARLSDGFVENGCIECPLHQGLVDMVTGAARSAPITEPVRTFPVRLNGARLEVQVEDAGS